MLVTSILLALAIAMPIAAVIAIVDVIRESSKTVKYGVVLNFVSLFAVATAVLAIIVFVSFWLLVAAYSVILR